MKYNNTKKYKVIDAKVNKKLIGDEVTLQSVKTGGDGNRRKKKKVKQPSLRSLILEIQSTLVEHSKHFERIDGVLSRNSLH